MYLILLSSVIFFAALTMSAPTDESENTDNGGFTDKRSRSAILIPPNASDLTKGNMLDTLEKADDRKSVCGIRRNSIPDAITRIVGGTPAEHHEFPWQVSLQWKYNWYTYHVCGASIINDRWLATAAHCTHQFTAKDLVVVAGDHQLKQKEGAEQTRYIEKIVEHQSYDTNTQAHDIAMIKLKTPLVLDGVTTSAICLPTHMANFTGDGVVTGWGKLAENGRSSDELLKVIVPIITDSECQKDYRMIGYSGPITDGMICAGHSIGGKDACQGDSGGPFVCRGRDNRYYLGGIVSWGVGCARPNVPGVYTEVSRYVSWVNRVITGRIDIPERPANSNLNPPGDADAITVNEFPEDTEEVALQQEITPEPVQQ